MEIAQKSFVYLHFYHSFIPLNFHFFFLFFLLITTKNERRKIEFFFLLFFHLHLVLNYLWQSTTFARDTLTITSRKRKTL